MVSDLKFFNVMRRHRALDRFACLVIALTLALGCLSPPVSAQNAEPAAEPAAVPDASSTAEPAVVPAVVPVATAPAPAIEQPILLQEVQEPAANLRAAIDALETAVDAVKDNDQGLAQQRIEIEALLSGSDLFLENLQPRYQAVNAQVQRLGPPPGKDAPPESRQILEERANLNILTAEIDGAIKSTGLVQYRARELLSKVQEYRARIFTSELLRRSDSPLSTSTWNEVNGTLPRAVTDLQWIGWRWWRSAKENAASLIGIVALSVLIYAMFGAYARRFVGARLTLEGPHPSYFERAATAGWVAPLVAIPAAAAAALLTFGLDYLGLLFLGADRLVVTALPAFLVFVAVSALAHAILQPNRPRWRLVDLDDVPARALTRAVTMIGAVYAIDFILKEVIRILALPLAVSVIETFLASVILAALFLKVVRTRFTPAPASIPEAASGDAAETSDGELREPVEHHLPLLSPRILKLPLLAVAAVIVAASLLGYVALGRFIAGQVIVTSSAIVLVLLLHLAIRAFVADGSRGGTALRRGLGDGLGLEPGQVRSVAQATTVALNVLLALFAIPLVLLTWGFTPTDTAAWLKALIFGFEIGQLRISLARIVLALALFVALLFVTRLVQRWLSASILKTTRVDAGIANSIHTGVGYAGFAVAVLAALSYSGLDITNLAIVAGALSVGIGFGLQSIVNNFVSGLILLVERPIKVGDLVAVNGQTGRVRNIAVRSTEIETGDKASLIVPNSELITGMVTNWTHRNQLARVNIKVTASAKSDPEQVRDVLLKVAAESSLLMQSPKPDVSFDNFGANGFEFSVSGVVSDVGRGGGAQTDLRLRIVKAFRAAGIEMPFAQHDVHLRDLDFVKGLLSRLGEQRTAAAAPVQAPTPDDGVEPAQSNGEPPAARKPRVAPVKSQSS